MDNMQAAEAAIKRTVHKRLIALRSAMVFKYPFYGSLLMHLKLALANCGTAATDMNRIIFDPHFANCLTDDELSFVLMHEVMHCALAHCVRGKDKHNYVYNVAADIVVNSNIMQSMGVTSFQVDGNEVMHLAPDGTEGYLYSADELYEMLWEEINDNPEEGTPLFGELMDSHDIWKTIPIGTSLQDEWVVHVEEAGKTYGLGNTPPGARLIIDELKEKGKLNWRNILFDFIKIIFDRYDFDFIPPDKRFSTGDLILPAFMEQENESVEDIWFVVDTSGSISDDMLEDFYMEIKGAIEQFDKLSAKLSFFDTSVSDPVPFDSVESLLKIRPVGGGGTDFREIFNYMRENLEENMPSAVIVLTDGYSIYPEESAAMLVPVLWVITEEENTAPWGVTVHIES